MKQYRHEIDGLRAFIEYKADSRIGNLTKIVKNFALNQNIHIYNLNSIFCPDDEKKCNLIDKENMILLYHYGKVTIKGANVFGKKLVEDPIFLELISEN